MAKRLTKIEKLLQEQITNLDQRRLELVEKRTVINAQIAAICDVMNSMREQLDTLTSERSK